MTVTWLGFSNATIYLILSITCLIVATDWAWYRSKSKSDAMLTSNGFPLFCEVWWADQVSSTGPSVTVTVFSHSYSIASCGLSILGRREFLFGEEGRPDIGVGVWRSWNCLHFLLSDLQLSTLFTFGFFGWVLEYMMVLWKEVVAVVAVGLWSMLSMADVVKSPIPRTGEQTTPSSTYLLTWISRQCRYLYHPFAWNADAIHIKHFHQRTQFGLCVDW